MRGARFILGLALLGGLGGPAGAQQPARLVMATTLSQDGSFAAQWLAMTYTEAFHELGIELEIRVMSPARASVEAEVGNVDGELARGAQYANTHPALRRVPEPSFTGLIAAYARDPAIKLQPGWEGLRNSPYRVEYRTGYPIYPQRLPTVMPNGGYAGVPSAKLGLRKLVIGRSDLYLDVVDVIDPLLTTAEFRNSGIHLAAVMEPFPVYAYFNKKHEKLVPRMAAVLKKMRESGQIERLRQQAMKDSSD